MKRVLAIAVSMLTCGIAMAASAASSGTVFVYVQRLTAARSWMPITCGDVVAAQLKRGKFFAMELPPGRYTLAPESGAPMIIDVHSGEDAYIRLDWIYHVGQRPIPVLSAVRPERACKEMKYLSYVDANKIRSSAVSKTDPRPPEPLELKKRDDRAIAVH